MQEGIVRPSTDDEIAEFIINQVYPVDTYPALCTLTGERAFGLSNNGPHKYFGLHFMDTWECLEHPKYRQSPNILKERYLYNLQPLPEGEAGGDIILDSFEIWKFVDMMLKGSIPIYELLYMPFIHQDPESEELIALCREGLSNKIGRAAKDIAQYDWRKHKNNQEKTVLTYYRLLQAIFYLREGEFEWHSDVLLDYIEPARLIPQGIQLIRGYEGAGGRIPQENIPIISQEIDRLIGETDRAMMVTRLPDQYIESVLREVLSIVRTTRSRLI